MADVTHTSVGYTGTVDQVAEAKRFGGGGAAFRAASASDWALTVDASTNLTVDIAAGTGQAFGVRDTTTAAATVTAAANSSGSTRLDVIVATFNWAAATPNTSFGIVQGTTSLPAVNTGGSPVAGQINRIPGVQYDAVLGVLEVRNGVGLLATGDLYDSRTWGGWGGRPLVTPTTKYRSIVDAAFPFVSSTTTPYAVWSTAVSDDNYRVVGRISIPDPGYAYRVRSYGTVELTGAGGGRVDSYMNIGSTSWSTYVGTPGAYNLHRHADLSPATFTGAQTLELRAYRQSTGVGTWTSTNVNFSMSAEVVAA